MAAKTAAKKKEEPVEDSKPESTASPDQGQSPAAPVKRSIGAKEPIVFKWKLLGNSNGVILTLFKAVEREEIEGHYERVAREGYYVDLRIVDIDEKVIQTKPAVPILPKAGAKKAKTEATPKKKKK